MIVDASSLILIKRYALKLITSEKKDICFNRRDVAFLLYCPCIELQT